MYFQEDLSLARSVKSLMFRQAVYDLLKRVQVSLEELESKLHLVERHGQRQAFYQEILSDLESLNCEGEQNTAVVNGLKDKIRRVQGDWINVSKSIYAAAGNHAQAAGEGPTKRVMWIRPYVKSV